MTDKPVVCQVCGAPMAIREWIRGSMKHEINPDGTVGKENIEVDDIDGLDLYCTKDNDHDHGIALDDDDNNDEDRYKVEGPPSYLLILTERGVGALEALEHVSSAYDLDGLADYLRPYECDMLKLLTLAKSRPVVPEGSTNAYVPKGLQEAYDMALESKFVEIIEDYKD